MVFFLYFDLPEEKVEGIFQTFGIVPSQISLITLITYQFLHGGLLHLIFNMWALWIFGDNLEDRTGHRNFLFFYILCGIIAGLINTIIQAGSEIPCVGASGSISGVLGAYLVLYPGARILCFFPIFFFIEIPALFFGGIWFIFQLLNGLFVVANEGDSAGVAWWAHIGGFVAGIFLIFYFLPKNLPPEENRDDVDI